jgi:predicted MFS family arabinose efflux permease
VLGFVAGGAALQATAKWGAPLVAFGLLFSVAMLSRLASAHYLGVQREPATPGPEMRTLKIGRLLGLARSDPRARLLLYMLGVQMATWIAGPYFTPYMFVHLGFSYSAFVALTCVAFLSKIAILPALGKVAKRWGPRRLLWISGALIVPVPALWLIHHGFVYLAVLQVVSGAAWGAYELAMLLLLFEAIPRQKRLGVLTVFNVANAAAIAGGSLVGGTLLATFGAGTAAYVALFAASSVARVAPLLLLVKLPTEGLRHLLVATRPIALRPSVGAVDRPVLASLEKEAPPPGETPERLAAGRHGADHGPGRRERVAPPCGPTVPA